MPSILICDDDVDRRRILSHALERHGYEVSVYTSAAEACRVIARAPPDVALLRMTPLHFTDAPLGQCLAVCNRSTILLIVENPIVSDAVRTLRPRNCNAPGVGPVVEHIVSVVTGVEPTLPYAATDAHVDVPHVITRWAGVVLRVIDSPRDPKTLASWGRWVAASPGTLRNGCRTARLRARGSLTFARMLRVVVHNLQNGSSAEELLDVSDRRTMLGLLRLGDAMNPPVSLPISIEEFLALQKWITHDRALAEIRKGLR